MSKGKPITISVEAINKEKNLMIINGEVCPITRWIDDEGEEIPTHEDAVGLVVKLGHKSYILIMLSEIADLENQELH